MLVFCMSDWNPYLRFTAPVFTNDPVENQIANWETCIYYWWYEYLKCNKEYEKYLKGNLKHHKSHQIFRNFGDLYSSNFKDWWEGGQRGKELFSELGNNEQFTVLDDYDDVKPWLFDENEAVIHLQVPLRTQSKRSLKKAFNDLLNETDCFKALFV